MRAIVLLAAFAAMGFAAYRITLRYRATTGSMWQRVLATAKGSATVLWSYIVVIGTTLMTWSVNVADAFDLPDVRNWVQAHLTPEMFGIALVTVALVAFFARMRTL